MVLRKFISMYRAWTGLLAATGSVLASDHHPERGAALSFYQQSSDEHRVLVFGDGRLYFDLHGIRHDNWPNHYFCVGGKECEPDFELNARLQDCQFPTSYFEAVIVANTRGYLKLDGAEYEAAMRLVQPGGKVVTYCDHAYEAIQWSDFKSRQALSEDDLKRVDEVMRDNNLSKTSLTFFNRGTTPDGEQLGWVAEVFSDRPGRPGAGDSLRRRIQILNGARQELAQEINLPPSLRSMYFSTLEDVGEAWYSKAMKLEGDRDIVLTFLKEPPQSVHRSTQG